MFKQSISSGVNLYRFGKNIRFFATSIAGAVPQKKDYYSILGLGPNATTDEIKNAYRELAKRFHPDVSTKGDAHEPNTERFKDVAEAYAILSVTETRIQYDLSNKTNPDNVFAAQRMETTRVYHNRGKDGNPIKPSYPAGTYAAEKQEILREQREKFNIDEFGRFKGGVPQKGKGTKRGSSLGSAGEMHDPEIINMKLTVDPAEQRVTAQDALAFKNYMQDDAFGITRRWTYFEASVDYDYFKFNNYRYAFRILRNAVIYIFGLSFLAEVYLRAKNRSIIDEVLNYKGDLDLTRGIKVGETKVIVTPNGILKRL